MSTIDAQRPQYFTRSLTFIFLALMFLAFGFDVTNYLNHSYAGVLIKYLYFLAIVGLLLLLIGRHTLLNTRPAHGFLFLALSLASAIAFTVKIIMQYPHSYASALLPLVVVALMVGIPNLRSYIDFKFMQAFLMYSGLLISSVLVGLQILSAVTLDSNLTSSNDRTFVVVFTFCICFIMRRWLFSLYMIVLLMASMMLRPSSSLLAGLIPCMLISVLFRFGAHKLAYITTISCVILLSLFPLIYVMAPDSASVLLEIETSIKDYFESTSNTEFRIALMNAAREELLSGSLLFGKMLVGTPTVYVNTWSAVTIHSDFMILLTQGGLLIYTIFIVALLGVLFCAIGGLKIGIRLCDKNITMFYQCICITVVLLSVYISFNPILQKFSIAYFFWFIFLISGLGWRHLRFTAEDRSVARNEPFKYQANIERVDPYQVT